LQQRFEIHPSYSQLRLTLAGHALIAVAIGSYVEPFALGVGGMLLVGLLALHEARRQLQLGIIYLKFNVSASSIELEQCGQPYFYGKYKVYATRWFAILKLIDKQKTRTLILNSDRCNSIQSYRQLRYALQQIDQVDAA